MPTFYFQILDGDGGLTDTMADFESLDAAIEEARTTLAAIAADGLPMGESMVSIEIYDESRKPLREIRLVLEEIDKSTRMDDNIT